MSDAPITEDLVEDKAAEVAEDLPEVQETVEDRAHRMGWRPEAEFKGDKARWIDAETFVKRGEEILPIVQANNKQMEKALKASDARVAQLEKSLAKFADYNSKSEQRAYERALKDLKADQRAAVEANDIDAVDEITDKIVDLKAEVTGKPAKDAQSDFEATRDAWISENKWFEEEPDMRAFAIGVGEELAGKNVPPDKQLDQIAERVKKAFAAKFATPANPRRAAAAAVEGHVSARRSGNTYADLPADAKKICDEFVRDIPGFTREKYLKDFDFGGQK